MTGLSASDVAMLSGNCNDRNNFFGEDMWAFLMFAMVFGWGDGGFGWGGGRRNNTDLQGMATRADINEAFALNGLNNGLDTLKDGQVAGFNSVNAGLANLGYRMQECCCAEQRAIDGVNYNMAKNTCDITSAIKDVNYNMSTGFNAVIQNTHNDADRIIAKMDTMETARLQREIQALRDNNQTLKFQISQNAQNDYLVAKLQHPTPIPAYSVPAPYPYAGGYNYGCGYNNGCGCGC